MRYAHLAALALAFVVAGCGGSGSTGSAPSLPSAANAPASAAKITLDIAIPYPPATSSSTRAPRYVSNGTRAIAVYDGSTLLYVANVILTNTPALMTLYAKSGSNSVAPGDCTRGNLASTCTFTVTATVGPHTFGVTAYGDFQGGFSQPGSTSRSVLDTGTPPAFTGLILSEGEFSMTAVAGNNPQQTLTLLGVADIVQWFGVQTANFGDTVSIFYAIQDARSGQIITPGSAYDNGPVTITAAPSGIVTFTPVSQSAPPSTSGSQSFNVTCSSANPPNSGNVTFTANAGNHPNATYASGLTYTNTNYSSGTLSQRTFHCAPGFAP